jgi:hypothetical protein
MTTGGVMVGWLVSRMTFSGHLWADLIRITALLRATDSSANVAGAFGRSQPGMNNKAASVPPTKTKYRATGNAHRS